MISNGYKKRFTDHRDLDLLKSFGATTTEGLPRTYIVDTLKDIPDQNADGLPMGCTAYAQCELASDQSGQVYDKREFYLSTPPGGFGGRDMRASLGLLVNRGPKLLDGTLIPWNGKYYNIYKQGIFDWFDAVRVGLYIVKQENRAATTGMPWFAEWCKPVQGSGLGTVHVNENGILPEAPLYDWNFGSAHDAVIAGWTDVGVVHGQPLGDLYLAIKSWQGKNVGDSGWVYMSRAIANKVYDMYYTEIFTASQVKPPSFSKVDLPVIEAIISFILSLFKTSKTAPVAPQEPLIAEPTPNPVIPPPAPKQSLLGAFCLAIQSREGFFAPGENKAYPNGTPAWRNNNPGNCRFSSQGYAAVYGVVKKSDSGFAIFKDYATGFLYLQNLVKEKIAKNPNQSIYGFFKNYAPSTDGNDPNSYAREVANKLKVPFDSWPIKNLLA